MLGGLSPRKVSVATRKDRGCVVGGGPTLAAKQTETCMRANVSSLHGHHPTVPATLRCCDATFLNRTCVAHRTTGTQAHSTGHSFPGTV